MKPSTSPSVNRSFVWTGHTVLTASSQRNKSDQLGKAQEIRLLCFFFNILAIMIT